uniref:Putative secreted protein n=1 Tax=Ixodes scapularis TaxID=6945 RepID=A0A4D5RBU0_IXOSC
MTKVHSTKTILPIIAFLIFFFLCFSFRGLHSVLECRQSLGETGKASCFLEGLRLIDNLVRAGCGDPMGHMQTCRAGLAISRSTQIKRLNPLLQKL